MKAFWILLLLVHMYGIVCAQIYYTRNGEITFFSDTPLEKIEAINRSSSIVFDFTKGQIEAATLIKGFQFDKALMQEHFNENYMESNKYPKAVFKGSITGYTPIDLFAVGEHNCIVSGELTIRNISRNVESPCTISVKENGVDVKATFIVALADYHISIPSVVRDKIAKTVEVIVSATLGELNK